MKLPKKSESLRIHLSPEIPLEIATFRAIIENQDEILKIRPLLNAEYDNSSIIFYPDQLELRYSSGPELAKASDTTNHNKEEQINDGTPEVYRVLFHPVEDGVACVLDGKPIYLPQPPEKLDDIHKKITARNASVGIEFPPELLTDSSGDISSKPKRSPILLPQPTFYEACTGATAISDGRDLRDWKVIEEGIMAMLHTPEDSEMQTRFEPGNLLLNWWGSPSGAKLEVLKSELQNLEFDALVTYFVCLSWAIEDYQVTSSLDNIIEAIGRGTDARRSAQTRKMWRAKVWRWMLLFDSLAVVGARPGSWKEPRVGDNKREKIDPTKIHSKDALLKIIGTRDTEQGTFDKSEPPKEVSFVAGPWVNQWRGNRGILSQFGNVRAIASIPRGKPSGAWVACVGFALQQKWREQASRAPITRITKGTQKLATQKFAAFTRRKLLAQLWRSDVDPEEILNGSNPERAKEYWDAAIALLRENDVIGYYKEDKPLKEERQGWQGEWLDQPLDIRPTGDNQINAIKISTSASAARKRGRRKSAPKKSPSDD